MESFEKAEIFRLSLSFEDRPQNNLAVSDVYFKNVVNELVKTKKYLQNLQKSIVQDRQENQKLKHELQGLRFTAQHLQRQHKIQTEEIKELKLKLEAYESPDMNESFELEAPEQCEYSETAVQTDLELVGPAGSFVNMLQQKIEDLKQENEHLMHQYDDLKNKVNSWLHGEKMKDIRKNKDLYKKENARPELFQVPLKNQESGEQSQENITIQKENLNQTEEDNSSKHQRSFSSKEVNQSLNFGWVSQSLSFQHTIQSITSTAKHDSQLIAGNRVSLFPLHNGFTNIDDEDSVDDDDGVDDDDVTNKNGGFDSATTRLPFSRYTADEPTNSPSSFGSAMNQLPVNSGVIVTQQGPCPEVTCSNCSLTFHEESNFIHHLANCDSKET